MVTNAKQAQCNGNRFHADSPFRNALGYFWTRVCISDNGGTWVDMLTASCKGKTSDDDVVVVVVVDVILFLFLLSLSLMLLLLSLLS